MDNGVEIVAENQPFRRCQPYIRKRAVVALRHDQETGIVRAGPFISGARTPGIAIVIPQRQPRGVAG